ncbi:hypothetical protein B0H14DRAFT_2417623, partial [Mycena olivaceomarginata]
LGYGLAAAIAARPNIIVFERVRDPTAQSVKELTVKHPNIHSVKLTSGDKVDNEAAIAEIQKTAQQLDVVAHSRYALVRFIRLRYHFFSVSPWIANYYGPLVTTTLSEFREH